MNTNSSAPAGGVGSAWTLAGPAEGLQPTASSTASKVSARQDASGGREGDMEKEAGKASVRQVTDLSRGHRGGASHP